jgi:hypothetical protein
MVQVQKVPLAITLSWFKFLETFQKDILYIEEFATVEQAFKRIGSFRGFVAGFKRYINNPSYEKHFQLLQHLEVKHVGKKLYFIYHTDTIIIHSTKFAKYNICLQRLGFPRIQNA